MRNCVSNTQNPFGSDSHESDSSEYSFRKTASRAALKRRGQKSQTLKSRREADIQIRKTKTQTTVSDLNRLRKKKKLSTAETRKLEKLEAIASRYKPIAGRRDTKRSRHLESKDLIRDSVRASSLSGYTLAGPKYLHVIKFLLGLFTLVNTVEGLDEMIKGNPEAYRLMWICSFSELHSSQFDIVAQPGILVPLIVLAAANAQIGLAEFLGTFSPPKPILAALRSGGNSIAIAYAVGYAGCSVDIDSYNEAASKRVVSDHNYRVIQNTNHRRQRHHPGDHRYDGLMLTTTTLQSARRRFTTGNNAHLPNNKEYRKALQVMNFLLRKAHEEKQRDLLDSMGFTPDDVIPTAGSDDSGGIESLTFLSSIRTGPLRDLLAKLTVWDAMDLLTYVPLVVTAARSGAVGLTSSLFNIGIRTCKLLGIPETDLIAFVTKNAAALKRVILKVVDNASLPEDDDGIRVYPTAFDDDLATILSYGGKLSNSSRKDITDAGRDFFYISRSTKEAAGFVSTLYGILQRNFFPSGEDKLIMQLCDDLIAIQSKVADTSFKDSIEAAEYKRKAVDLQASVTRLLQARVELPLPLRSAAGICANIVNRANIVLGSSQSRNAPITIILAGPAAVYKSTVALVLREAVITSIKGHADPYYDYPVTESDDIRMDGINNETIAISFDDLWKSSDHDVRSKQSRLLFELSGFDDFVPNMAELSNKGTIHPKPAIITATTNEMKVVDPPADFSTAVLGLTSSEAFFRRIDYIAVPKNWPAYMCKAGAIMTIDAMQSATVTVRTYDISRPVEDRFHEQEMNLYEFSRRIVQESIKRRSMVRADKIDPRVVESLVIPTMFAEPLTDTDLPLVEFTPEVTTSDSAEVEPEVVTSDSFEYPPPTFNSTNIASPSLRRRASSFTANDSDSSSEQDPPVVLAESFSDDEPMYTPSQLVNFATDIDDWAVEAKASFDVIDRRMVAENAVGGLLENYVHVCLECVASLKGYSKRAGTHPEEIPTLHSASKKRFLEFKESLKMLQTTLHHSDRWWNPLIRNLAQSKIVRYTAIAYATVFSGDWEGGYIVISLILSILSIPLTLVGAYTFWTQIIWIFGMGGSVSWGLLAASCSPAVYSVYSYILTTWRSRSRFVNAMKIFTLLSLFLLCILFIYYYYRKDETTKTSVNISGGDKTTFGGNLPDIVLTADNNSSEQQNRARKYTYVARRCDPDNTVTRAMIISLGDCLYAGNTHFLHEMSSSTVLKMENLENLQGVEVEWSSCKVVTHVVDGDITFFETDALPRAKPLDNLFFRQDQFRQLHADSMNSVNNPVSIMASSTYTGLDLQVGSNSLSKPGFNRGPGYWCCRAAVRQGDSGALWFVHNTKMDRKIIGFQVAMGGNSTQAAMLAFASPVTSEVLVAVRAKMTILPLENPSVVTGNLESPIQVPLFEDVVPTGLQEKVIDLLPAAYYGIITKCLQPGSPQRSRICRTTLAAYAEEYGWDDCTDRPARLTPGNQFVPFAYRFKKMKTQSLRYTPRLHSALSMQFARWMITKCFRPLKARSKIPMSEAIESGRMRELNAVNLATSPGFPLSSLRGRVGGKRPFIDRDEDDKLVIHPVTKALVVQDLCTLRAGRVPLWILSDTPKDEVRPIEAYEAGKTRYVYPVPLPAWIIGRMYFADFISWLQCMVPYGPNMVTLDINSDWPKVWMTLRSGDRNLIAGDISGHDFFVSSGTQSILQTLSDEFYRTYSPDYGTESYEEDNKIRHLLFEFLRNPFHSLFGVVFQTNCGVSSGHWATAEFNGCTTAYMMFFIFIYLALRNGLTMPHALCAWTDEVGIVVYGDDHVISVDKRHTWFNQNTIRIHLKAIFGMDYTDPNKNVVFPDYCALEDLSFLKRYFRYEDGQCIAYMPLPDIRRRMFHWNPESDVDEYSHICQVLDSFLRDVVMLGKEVYEEEAEKIQSIMFRSYKRRPMMLSYLEAHPHT